MHIKLNLTLLICLCLISTSVVCTFGLLTNLFGGHNAGYNNNLAYGKIQIPKILPLPQIHQSPYRQQNRLTPQPQNPPAPKVS